VSERVLVLGAAGRLGYVAAEAFRDTGWTVISLARPGHATRVPSGTEIVEADALDHQAVAAAAHGASVIAATLVRLAATRERLGRCEAFGFPGHAVTGRELTTAIARTVGRRLPVKPMTWWLIHLGRPIVPLCRELSEIASGTSRTGSMAANSPA
jgi:NAD(P)-dependent dehydrogenase (short-subunit alcohol dehydrogenase family)